MFVLDTWQHWISYNWQHFQWVATKRKKEIMKLCGVKTARMCEAENRYVRNLIAKNSTSYICLLDSQILMLMEKRGHSVYFVWKLWLRTAWRRINKKYHEREHVKYIGKTSNFLPHRKLNEFNKQKRVFAKITTVTSEPLIVSFKVAYRIATRKKVIILEKVCYLSYW